MISIHYNDTTGEIINAYHDSCRDIPTPGIVVEDAVWSNAVQYQSRRIDLVTKRLTYDAHELETEAIKAQIAEIDKQLNAIDLKMIRCIDEIQAGEDTSGDAAAARAKLKTEKVSLRTERANLFASLQ